MDHDPALAMAAEYVEVCFPAWPASRSLAVPIGATLSRAFQVHAPGAAAALATALLVPAAIAALSLVALTLMLGFVLLAPAFLALLVWTTLREDRDTSLRAEVPAFRVT
jgi:hypothetical protein